MKKRILLVTSAAPEKSPFSTLEKRAPLGVGYLISVLREEGHEVFFIDNYLKPSPFLAENYLQTWRIDYVGIYANTICFADTLRMMKAIEDLRSGGSWNGKIIIGGPHTSVAPDSIPAYVDHIVQGEGEPAILDIVNGIEQRRLVRKPRLKDLDQLPYPAWDYFFKLPYDFTTRWTDEAPVFTMNTSRGCPFGCNFCSVDSIWGKQYVMYSAPRIIDEIKYLIHNFGARGIYFREDNFTLNSQRVKEFCQLLLRENIHVEWVCETRVDTLDYPLLKTMRDAGCIGLYIGVESGSERMLEVMNKGISLGQVRKVFRWCKRLKIRTYASFIAGIPTETFEDLLLTRKLIREIEPDFYGTSVFVGIPNSHLYRYVLGNNLYDYKDPLGLLYLKGYNRRVDRYYKGREYYKIDTDSEDWIDYEMEEALMKQRMVRRLKNRIKNWRSNRKKIVIYGAGKQTEALFREFDFTGVRIVAFADQKYKEKKIFMNIPVLSPARLGEIQYDEIFISLTVHGETVYRDLKKRLGSSRGIRISRLYKPEEFFLLNPGR